MVEKNRGFTRVVKASYYSYKGLVAAWRYEAAFRQECVALAVLVPLALWLDVTIFERILLISSLVIVLIVELLNSGIEAVVDRIGEEHHELSGRAKDLGSAAVMLSIFMGAGIWLGLLWHKLPF